MITRALRNFVSAYTNGTRIAIATPIGDVYWICIWTGDLSIVVTIRSANSAFPCCTDIPYANAFNLTMGLHHVVRWPFVTVENGWKIMWQPCHNKSADIIVFVLAQEPIHINAVHVLAEWRVSSCSPQTN
ncbi:MAG: hypothetical protein OKBPIBMD_00845 [Chlorobi bacterium]|nr:hypothetical protein [Chlorobiota bacterium]